MLFIKPLLRTLFLALLLLPFTPHLFAESISINFEGGRLNPCCGGGGTAVVSAPAGFVISTNWNNQASNADSNLPLQKDDGTTASALLTYDGPNNWAAVNPAPGGAADADMMSGYLDNMGGRSITVTSLDGAFTANGYDVIVFMSSDSAGSPGFSIGSTTYYGTQSAAGLNYPLSGGTNGYVFSTSQTRAGATPANALRFSNLNTTSFTIIGAAGGGGDRARPNGIQIISREISGGPTVANQPVSSLTPTSAQLNGIITHTGTNAPAVTIYFGEQDLGASTNGWDAAYALPGTYTNTFAVTATNLSPGTRYYYRTRATNNAGANWAIDTLDFLTPEIPPAVTNVAATDIAATSATLGATITETGGDLPSVTLYYGTADAGTNNPTWQNNIHLGPLSGTGTRDIINLTPSTTYFFRSYATNSAGAVWASTTATFSTLTPHLPVVDNKAPTGITGTTANLRGEVTDTGFDEPSIILYYGDNDGGTNSNAWQFNVSLGLQGNNFSTFVNGLTPQSTVYYRAFAQNIAGSAWAASTETFSTTAFVPTTVVINEINYNPLGISPTEFVELYNPGDEVLDLSGWSITNAISYTIPPGTTLSPGNFLVISDSPPKLAELYQITSLGPFSNQLNSVGETVELRDDAGNIIDEVDYGIGFPWPTAAAGGGASIELIHPTLDNDLAGSWRASNTNGLPPGVRTLIPASSTDWRWRKGTSEASTPIENWRQIGFTEDASWNNASLGTPIGYADGDDNTLITDMENQYLSLYLRHRFVIDAFNIPDTLTLRVYVDDGCVVWLNGTEIERFFYDDGPSAFNTPANEHEADWVEFTINNASSILNGGDNVLTILAANSVLDSDDFSIDAELLTPAATSPLGTSTPGSQNSVFALNAPPHIRQVDHSPNQPATGEAVTITARITDPDGVGPVYLSYQIVDPGNYIRKNDAAYEDPANWITIAMNDEGISGDADAHDATFSATIPANVQTHRRLIRYRIQAEDLMGVSLQVPYEDDEQPNFAYFVYDGTPAWTASDQPGVTPTTTFAAATQDEIPAYHLIANPTDVNNSQYVGAFDGVHMEGTMVFDGEVYDHIEFENRGEASTYQSGKNKWRFHFNRARDFAARDNWGEKYNSPFDELNLDACASPWAPVNRGMAGLDEAISYRMYELAGTPSPRTHYVHFRVIDEATEAPANQYAGDLWGLYISIEHPDGSFLKDRNLVDGNVYKIEGGAGDKKHQGFNQITDSSDWNTFRNNSDNNQNSEAFWRANMDLNAYFTFRAGNRINGNVDVRYGSNHLFYLSPVNGWTVMPWDLDMMFIAETHWSGTIQQEACLNIPAIALEYRNRAREMFDLFCTDASPTGGQLAQLVDEYAQMVNPTGQAQTWADIDQFMWNYHPNTRGNPSQHLGQGNHKGNFYYSPFQDQRRGGNYIRDLTSPNHEGFVQYLIDYTSDTFTGGAWAAGNGIPAGYGFEFAKSDASDPDIPIKPSISYNGSQGYPSDTLNFSTTTFSDPQGAGTFAAMQWRLGEISNPSTPLYETGTPYTYEIEEHWNSGERTTFSETISLSPVIVRVGHTYRLRVKMQDDTGRWSHWSDPIEFVVSEPDLTAWKNDLMITELMYHPSETTHAERMAGFTESDFEFIEMQNVGTNILDLSELRFTKGVDFDFAGSAVTNLSPNAYVIIARNIAAFESRYGPGLPVAGAYGPDNLSNNEENVKLSFGAGSAIHEFTYDDRAPWPQAADGYGPSLQLISPTNRPDHTVASNWTASTGYGTPNGLTNPVAFIGDPLADIDNDGLRALVEYALGTSDANPNDTADAYTFAVEVQEGIDYATFSYQRNTDALGIGIVVEISKDLVSWETAPDRLLERVEITSPSTSMNTWRSEAPLDDACYFRLRVIQF